MSEKGFNARFKMHFREISEIAHYLWERGWAERNAGNFSINLTGEVQFDLNRIAVLPVYSFKKTFHNLKNNFILVSASGSRMREISKESLKYCLILLISKTGNEYRYFNLSGDGKILSPDLQPTSEIQTHIAYQNLLREINSDDKAVLHSHPTEIIALTHLKKYTGEKKLNKLLFKMHPEIKMFIPEGVGLVSLITPGTKEIAEATLESAKTHKVVIWEKHGCFSSGKSLSDAFDLTDIVSKCAKIFFLTKSGKQKADKSS
jgi:rhamnulose-1-phosphate aldolase